jgi:hypothetical protein
MPTTRPPARGFRLVVEPHDAGTYDLRLEETNGAPGNTTTVARLGADRLTAYLGAIRNALTESGHKPTVLAPNRRTPINLREPAGVRLALTLNAGAPLTKPARRSAVIEGVATMSDEEAYYWYAKTARANGGRRALRALRILLSNDERSGVTA